MCADSKQRRNVFFQKIHRQSQICLLLMAWMFTCNLKYGEKIRAMDKQVGVRETPVAATINGIELHLPTKISRENQWQWTNIKE